MMADVTSKYKQNNNKTRWRNSRFGAWWCSW